MAKRIAVIGGGAAGLMAALYAARSGASVTLFERNEKLGKKIYITGKGRCNVTNAAEPEAFMKNIVRNPRFLYASFAALNNTGLMTLLEDLGVRLKVERGERVFPESDHASDVTLALEREIRRLGVKVLLNERVKRVLSENGRAAGVETGDGRAHAFDAIVVATGGLSYPTTGSTGDGYVFAKDAGHAIAPCRPALTSIETVEAWPERLMGLSLKNVTLSAYQETGGKPKKLFSEMGEMLFTHFGVTGPLVLTASAHMTDASGVRAGRYRLRIDLKPALDEAALDARIQADFSKFSNRDFINALSDLLPQKAIQPVAELSGIPFRKKVHDVTREERRALIGVLKGLELQPIGFRPLAEAIVTRGGVDVREVDPRTMQSKLCPGLYFAGEMLDVDATTGGYNLQIAFSTGHLAGISAAQAAGESVNKV